MPRPHALPIALKTAARLLAQLAVAAFCAAVAVAAQPLERMPRVVEGPAMVRVAQFGAVPDRRGGDVLVDPLGTIVVADDLPVPPLPPAPDAEEVPALPPLNDELWYHGGSYLYVPEGDGLGCPDACTGGHHAVLRLPETWQAPEPVTLGAEYLGADPVRLYPRLHWPGGYAWEPRFVAAGQYCLFGLWQEDAGTETALVGHQLLVDFDLRLTGTERFHVQYRPIGVGNTGGSYYQFTDPEGYVSNDTGVPSRYWFECEVHSLLGSWLNPFAVWDYDVTVGKFPFALQNNLLINDEILGLIVGKNTIPLGNASNVNVQLVWGVDDIDISTTDEGALYGFNTQIDWRQTRFDLNYFFVRNLDNSSRDAHYAAVSGSLLRGPRNYTARGLFKFGDEGGGQLLVLESNRVRAFHENCLGVESAVIYFNAFGASQGWTPISGGNFNRLRSSFEVNPLVAISAGRPPVETVGFALGAQFFRHHEDESWVPEIAFEAPGGRPVWGAGIRYLRKTGPRSFFEVLGVVDLSEDPTYERQGVYLSQSIFF